MSKLAPVEDLRRNRLEPTVASSRVAVRRRSRRRSATPSAPRAAALVLRLPLAEALGVCLRLADSGSPYFSRAALSCHSRLVGHVWGVGLGDAANALNSFAALGGPHGAEAAEQLHALCVRGGQDEAAAVLDEWAGRAARRKHRPECFGHPRPHE